MLCRTATSRPTTQWRGGNPNYFITYGNGKSAARIQAGLAAQWRSQMVQLQQGAQVSLRPTTTLDKDAQNDAFLCGTLFHCRQACE